jgi:hypothetical protein
VHSLLLNGEMAPYEGIAKRNAEDERLAFARQLLSRSDEIISFVDNRLRWDGYASYDGILGGSFNISLKLRRGVTDEAVIIRFPAPGKIHVPWRDEKVRNEVEAMSYIRQRTSIPVPRVRSWGLTKDSPGQLGPFIIMDFMPGENLGRFLASLSHEKAEPVFLNPDVDEGKLDIIYDQIATFMLELSSSKFSRIGALSKDQASGDWVVASRPFTYDMNEVVTVGGTSAGFFDTITGPFDRAGDYFNMCTRYFNLHMEQQRNIAGNDEDLAWSQYVARNCYPLLIPSHGAVDDDGPFRLFCDDLRPTNMLIDPDTLRITAVFDFEFTNAMPAQYSQDVPWWLLLQHPGEWLRDKKMDEFFRLFEPRKEQFIRAVQRIENGQGDKGEPLLSVRMQESWNSGRFWFNLATRCSFDVDDIYWHAFHREGMGEAMLSSAVLGEKAAFVERKMRQCDEYLKEKDSDARFDE